MTTIATAPTTTGNTFFNGFNDFLSGAKDTFSTLLEGGLAWEQYRAQRDAVGQGQTDLANSVTRDSQPQASPISATQYNPTTNQGSPMSGGGISQNTLLLGGFALAALLLLKR